MASSLPPPTAGLRRQPLPPLPTSPTPTHSTISLPRFFTWNSCTPTNILSSTSTLFHPNSYPFPPSISVSKSNSLSGCRSRCLATSSRPPSPPQSEPPSGKDPFSSSSSGLPDKFARFQEVVQIFLAVLFWMSLFFWSSIWDGKNNGRSDKGSRPRR